MISGLAVPAGQVMLGQSTTSGTASHAVTRTAPPEALRDGKSTTDSTFDLCDEQMSGVMSSYCSWLDERRPNIAAPYQGAIA
jgi:hypothetical protein